MKGFKSNIEKDTLENNHFRKVLYTGKHNQLVLMNLKVGGEIGEETHKDTDQFFRFESGFGKCKIDGAEYLVKKGDVIIVPSGAKHNVINSDDKFDLKLYTIYSPPHHKKDTIWSTKEEAEKYGKPFDGTTTEL